VELQTFTFGGRAPVRVVDRQGAPWWVAKDVCGALGLEETHKAVARLDDDDRNLIPVIDAKGRPQPTTIVSEAGLYALVLRSDKPEAKAFKRWITHEVLPAIRRTGAYQAPQGGPRTVSFRAAARELGIENGTFVYRMKLRPDLREAVLRGDLDPVRAYFRENPPNAAMSASAAARTVPKVLRVDSSGGYVSQALVQLLAELRQVYGPEGAQEVLHNLDPKTFPAPYAPSAQTAHKPQVQR
jgi:prophage antirepressor-like protein